MRPSITIILLILWFSPALADNEMSNSPHVVAGPSGRCYAKSVPEHIYDPDDIPRQVGQTQIFVVGPDEDVLVENYDWFSQQLYVLCNIGDPKSTSVVRLGPWQRGHNPRPDHLAIAFYQGGELVKSWSTLDIAGPEQDDTFGISDYKNASASVSHYTVFDRPPELVKIITNDGPLFSEHRFIRARTIDGRMLTFNYETGELIPKLIEK